MYTLDVIDTQFTSHGLGQIDCSGELESPITHCACVIGKFPLKLGCEKFYVLENILRTLNCIFIKNLLLKNAKKTCNPDNRDLNWD